MEPRQANRREHRCGAVCRHCACSRGRARLDDPASRRLPARHRDGPALRADRVPREEPRKIEGRPRRRMAHPPFVRRRRARALAAIHGAERAGQEAARPFLCSLRELGSAQTGSRRPSDDRLDAASLHHDFRLLREDRLRKARRDHPARANAARRRPAQGCRAGIRGRLRHAARRVGTLGALPQADQRAHGRGQSPPLGNRRAAPHLAR